MAAALLLLLLAGAGGFAQQIGRLVPEVHPRLPTMFCTLADGCRTLQTSVVADALSRPLQVVGHQPVVACSPATANGTQCLNAATCALGDCALEGVDYAAAGVSTAGAALTLRLLGSDGHTLSPRVYLLEETDAENDQKGENGGTEKNARSRYQLLRLVNRELTFDVDVSRVGCGVNGALYLVEMDATGGQSAVLNPAGAAYGTGYCDAQCPNASFTAAVGTAIGAAASGTAGACCNELDIWEANRAATALTLHACSRDGLFLCFGDQCGRSSSRSSRSPVSAPCDRDGCSSNPFRAGDHSFYRPGGSVDTRRPFTVVTRLVSADNTTAGDLVEISRLYIQEGRVITTAAKAQNMSSRSSPSSTIATTITDDVCADRGASSHRHHGGLHAMGQALARGMVAVFSIWESPGDLMAWLDSGSAGPCASSASEPASIAADDSDASITFSNIRWGDIGATVQIAPDGTVLQSVSAAASSRLSSQPSSSALSSLPSLSSSLPLSPSPSPSSSVLPSSLLTSPSSGASMLAMFALSPMAISVLALSFAHLLV